MDDDDKKSEDEAAEPARDAAQEEGAKLREVSEEDLERIALVALDFPVFSDGRAYSSARLLRERYGYKGEVRAIGDVLCEQLTFMLRSGFETFEMQSEDALDEFNSVVTEVRVVYQPTADGQATAIDRRLAGE